MSAKTVTAGDIIVIVPENGPRRQVIVTHVERNIITIMDVLEPGDPGYDEQGFGCCDIEDDPGGKDCQCRHRLYGDPRSPGQLLEDYNRGAARDGREPFTGTALEFQAELFGIEGER